MKMYASNSVYCSYLTSSNLWRKGFRWICIRNTNSTSSGQTITTAHLLQFLTKIYSWFHQKNQISIYASFLAFQLLKWIVSLKRIERLKLYCCFLMIKIWILCRRTFMLLNMMCPMWINGHTLYFIRKTIRFFWRFVYIVKI